MTNSKQKPELTDGAVLKDVRIKPPVESEDKGTSPVYYFTLEPEDLKFISSVDSEKLYHKIVTFLQRRLKSVVFYERQLQNPENVSSTSEKLIRIKALSLNRLFSFLREHTVLDIELKTEVDVDSEMMELQFEFRDGDILESVFDYAVQEYSQSPYHLSVNLILYILDESRKEINRFNIRLNHLLNYRVESSVRESLIYKKVSLIFSINTI